MGLPISFNWTFSLGRTAETLRAIISSKSAISLQRGPVDPKFQIEGVAPTNHSSSHKSRQNDLSHGIKIWTDFSSVLSQCTRLTDRRTDRNLIARPCLHSMQRGKNCWKDVRENTTTEVSVDKENPINFRKSSASRSWSRKFFKGFFQIARWGIFSTIWIV